MNAAITSYRKLVNDLSPIWGENEARAIASIVLEKLTGLTYHRLITRPQFEITAQQQDELQNYRYQLLQHKPIQYVLGHAEFYGNRIEVNESVLIPRPETEELVQWIVETYPNAQRILDIGTGSGCIAISLAKCLSQAKVWATDISESALDIATKNASSNKVQIQFLKHDALKNAYHFGAELCDVIVSNPPYVRESERKTMLPHVLNFEPSTALFVPDSDALKFYNSIAKGSFSILSAQGALFFEINESLAAETQRLLSTLGYTNIKIRKDLNGKDRMIMAQPNKSFYGK